MFYVISFSLISEAHSRGLSVGLKNDVDQIHSLVSYFDWALNEECVEYNECNKYQPFFDAGKVIQQVIKGNTYI